MKQSENLSKFFQQLSWIENQYRKNMSNETQMIAKVPQEYIPIITAEENEMDM